MNIRDTLVNGYDLFVNLHKFSLQSTIHIIQGQIQDFEKGGSLVSKWIKQNIMNTCLS